MGMNMTMNLATINMSESKNVKKSKNSKLPNINGVNDNKRDCSNLPKVSNFDENGDDDMMYDDDIYENDVDDEFSAASSSTVATSDQGGGAHLNEVKYIPILPDEAGTNETAGPISDWDFNNDTGMGSSINMMNTRVRLGEEDIINMSDTNASNHG